MIRAVIFVAISVGFVSQAFANSDKGFCWVPVINGEPTDADLNAAFRMIATGEFRIPGLPGPVYDPTYRDGRWTITPEGRYEEYKGLFPSGPSFLDSWLHEPENKRVVAAPFWGAENVLELKEGDGEFRAIQSAELRSYEPQERFRFGSTNFFRLQKPPQTLVQTCDQSVCHMYQLLPSGELDPWFNQTDAATLDGQSVSDIGKSEDNRLTVVVVSERDKNNSFVYASLDGQPYRLLDELGEGRIMHRGKIGGDGFTFGTPSRLIRVSRENNELTFDIFELRGSQRVSGPLGTGTYVRWSPESWFSNARYEYLEPGSSQWEPVAGIAPVLSERIFLLPARSIESHYFFDGDGLYIFDGKTAIRTTRHGQNWVRDGHGWVDATTQGRFLVFSESEIFEVGRDGVLNRLDVGPLSDIDPFSAEDEPELGAVTFRSKDKLQALWPDLTISELKEITLDRVDPNAPAAPPDETPWSGVTVETKDNRLWLRINLDRQHAPSCGLAD